MADQWYNNPNLDSRSSIGQVTQLSRNYLTDYNDTQMPWFSDLAHHQIRAGNDVNDAGMASYTQLGRLADYQLGQAQRYDQDYRGTYLPYLNNVMGSANRFASEAYKTEQAGNARRSAQVGFDQVADQRNRDMQRRGVNPFSARALGDQRAMDIDKTLAMESAAAKTRIAADQIGLQGQMGVLGQMGGMAGMSTTAANSAIGARNAQSGALAVANQGASTALSAGQSVLNANNTAFNSAMGAWNTANSGANQARAVQNQQDAQDQEMMMSVGSLAITAVAVI